MANQGIKIVPSWREKSFMTFFYSQYERIHTLQKQLSPGKVSSACLLLLIFGRGNSELLLKALCKIFGIIETYGIGYL